MAAMSEQHGHDEDFVDVVPDYLKCVVCHLVLKDPLQIMQCGHRYCNLCFQRIKEYSNHLNSDLCCPVDREVIDISKVFKDTGMSRIINDLHVKCSFQNNGCVWVGELRNLENHGRQCIHRLKDVVADADGVGNEVYSSIMKQMCDRLQKCEDCLLEKEKDLAYVKFHLHEIKEKVTRKEAKIDVLEFKNIESEKEINLIKEENQQLKLAMEKVVKTSEEEIDVLKLKNIEVEKEMNLIKEEMQKAKQCIKEVVKTDENIVLDGSTEEMDELKREITATKDSLRVTDENIKCLKIEVKELLNKLTERDDIEFQLCRSTDIIPTIKKDMKIIKEQLTVINNKDEIKEELHAAFVKKAIASQKLFQEIYNEIDGLRSDFNHTNNLLFCQDNISISNTVFVWRIHNFRKHFVAGVNIGSPMFYCCPSGHLCQLFCQRDKYGSNYGIYVRLASGKNSERFSTFSCKFVFAVLKIDGSENEMTITKEEVNANRSSLKQQYGTNVSGGLGKSSAITEADFPSSLIDNTLTIKCTMICDN